MEAGKLFETATRNKMRFPFRGMISVEDLWDLSLTNLDSVFKTLNAEAKNQKKKVFLKQNLKRTKNFLIRLKL